MTADHRIIKTNSLKTLSGATFHKVEVELTDDWDGEIVFRDKDGRLRLHVARIGMEHPENLKFQIQAWGIDGKVPSCTIPVSDSDKVIGNSVIYRFGLNEKGWEG